MKKVLSLITIFALLMTITLTGVYAQTTGISKITEPDYYKLDSDLSNEIKAAGGVVKGKEFRNANTNSYLLPNEGYPIQPIDARTAAGQPAKGIAILVDFPANEDETSAVPGVDYEQVPANYFYDLLNGTEYNPYDLSVFSWLAEYNGVPAPTDRTLKNYFNEVSYGQFEIDVDLAGWYTLSQPYDYYLGQDGFAIGNENGDARIAELVSDAIDLADEDIDFSNYAVDGKVPNIFIIHRGTGAEYNLDPTIIWSHKWDIVSATYYGYYYQTGEYMDEADLEYKVVDGVIVNVYNIVPEVGQDISGYLKYVYPGLFPADYDGREPSPAYPGVYSHEFAHILGLPDQYDYGYQSEGTGMYTLMAGGSYGRNINYRWYSGNTPVHLNAWDKWYLGFAEPIVVSSNQSITLNPVEYSKDIYKLVVPGSNGREYFLLENRQQIGYDTGLSYNVDGESLHGLVVYHIVDDMIQKKFNRPNEAQNWDINHLGKGQQSSSSYGQTHYGMSVIQADGNYDLEHGYNDADAGDVFPGKYNVTRLGSISNNVTGIANTSSLYKWDSKSTDTGINLENIVEDENGVITLDVVFQKK